MFNRSTIRSIINAIIASIKVLRNLTFTGIRAYRLYSFNEASFSHCRIQRIALLHDRRPHRWDKRFSKRRWSSTNLFGGDKDEEDEKVDDNAIAVWTGMYKYNRDVDEQVGFVPHLWRTQRLPDEDDAPLWWEEFRLLVPLGNVGRLYTGSSRPSDSSFLSRISDSSDPALRTLDPRLLLSSSTDSSSSFDIEVSFSAAVPKSDQGKRRLARKKGIIEYLQNFTASSRTAASSVSKMFYSTMNFKFRCCLIPTSQYKYKREK